ncbi:CopD family protein [Saccharopolyspora gloriosae]|uniref:Putative copper resistance protein D n=1 Tax=Saccharopolyspora gloriosae TaxID=455344 RepID=A0A840N9R4_9PSEU|nr:CopD family protein [Saccharopolyspora gloriosae]MBB5067133.1 putative copper resistance protein D [Saccharopolyspora gloriosae]
MSADTGTGPDHHRSGRAAPGRKTSGNGVRIAAIAPVVLASAAALAAAAHIGADEVPGLAAPDTATRFIAPPVRALLDLAAVATVGLGLLPRLVPDRGRHARRHLALSRRTAVITALAWLACALLLLVLYAAELLGGTPSAEDVAGYISGVPAGTALALSAVCAAGCAALGLTGVVRDGRTVGGGPANEGSTDDLRAVLALLGLLPMPLTGHATDWEYHNLSMISVQLHVLAAAVWAGGLAAVALFVAPHRSQLATALPRYSRLATAAILAVAASGLFNGLTELTATGSGLDGLVTTGYGRIVLLKTVLLALLAGLGGHARYRLLPRVERHRRTALIAWAAAELAVMGLAYGLGAVLARAPVLT